MRRVALLTLVLAVLLPAGLALLAQEPGKEGARLEEIIRELERKLAEKERARARPPVTFELHIYDVRDLVTKVMDYPGTELNLVPSGGYGFGFDEGEVEPCAFYEGDALVDLIRETVAPGSWGELASADISYYENGVILVRHTAGVHARIGDLLDRLRSRAASQVTVNLRLLRLSDATLRAVLAPDVGSVLSAEAERRLEDAVRTGKAKIVRRGALTCTNTQRVSLNDLGVVSYLQDYDVEIAQGASIPDPIVQSLREGFVGDVRPTIAGDGSLVVLEIQADAAQLRRPIETVVTPCGDIETPHVEHLKLRTTIGMPLGRSALIGGSLSDGDEDALLLVVTPVAKRPGAK